MLRPPSYIPFHVSSIASIAKMNSHTRPLQLLGKALRGDSNRAASFECGIRQMKTTHQFHSKFPEIDTSQEIWIHEFHRDQVLKLPPNGQLLASSPLCPVEIFGIDDRVLGIQGHPEFSHEYCRKLIISRGKDGTLGKELSGKALEEIERIKEPSNHLIGRAVRDWFIRDL